jgi:hypothetical protein
MNTSLYVAKADGDREVLDNVSVEMAREVFEKVDWNAQMAASQAEELAGRDVYIPEFGLADEAERALVISPVDSSTVTFTFQDSEHLSGVRRFPVSGVAELIDLYFAGGEDAIAAIVATYAAAREMLVRELSDAEFLATIAEPMHRLGEKETCRQVPLRDYLTACITICSLPASLETIELTDIYLSANKLYSHIHFNYGAPKTTLVIVVHYDPDNGDSVLGHHFANLAENCYYSQDRAR